MCAGDPATMMMISTAIQVGGAVMDYQNKKDVADTHTAANEVTMGHYNEDYLNTLSKIDNEGGNAVTEKALEEFKIQQKKSKDIAEALNLGFGDPLRAVQAVGGVADNDLNYVGFQFVKDMTTLQNQENEAYAHMVKGISSLQSPTQPSIIGTGLQIASAGINYRTEDLKRQGKWKTTG